MSDSLALRIANCIRNVSDFPKPGIQFKDITPLLANAQLLGETLAAMSEPFANVRISHVVGVESRGFLFGVSIAQHLHCAFVPARKPGKLPWKTVNEKFALEYGFDSLELHADALGVGARVLVVDDVLATGGTLAATCRLVERLQGQVVGVSVLAEIPAIRNAGLTISTPVHSLLQF
ncbi:MAG: adenine phosphoribosyltransferase [Gemmatimonadaceae bacterium]